MLSKVKEDVLNTHTGDLPIVK